MKVGYTEVDELLSQTVQSLHPAFHPARGTRCHVILSSKSADAIPLEIQTLPWLPRGLSIKPTFPSLTFKVFMSFDLRLSFRLHLLPSTLHIVPPLTPAQMNHSWDPHPLIL